MPDDTEVTIPRKSAVIALRALSEIWSDHEGKFDDEVMVAIEDIERVTGVRLELKARAK